MEEEREANWMEGKEGGRQVGGEHRVRDGGSVGGLDGGRE